MNQSTVVTCQSQREIGKHNRKSENTSIRKTQRHIELRNQDHKLKTKKNIIPTGKGFHIFQPPVCNIRAMYSKILNSLVRSCPPLWGHMKDTFTLLALSLIFVIGSHLYRQELMLLWFPISRCVFWFVVVFGDLSSELCLFFFHLFLPIWLPYKYKKQHDCYTCGLHVIM